jgi:hypothetical protein
MPYDSTTATIKSFTIRERSEQRVESMKAIRKPYEPDYQEIARLTLPSRSPFLTPSAQGLKRRANTSKQDTAGRIAGRTLVNGMSTGLSSNARPWFKFSTGDPDLDGYAPVKEWLYEQEVDTYAICAQTNYYDANKVAYAQLGHMGTAVNVGVEHDRYLAVWHPLEAMEYYISQDEGLRVDGLARLVVLTVQQMCAMFDWAKLSDPVKRAYNMGRVHELVRCWNLIEYNKDRDGDYWDYGNKPWRSIWWEEAGTSKKDEDLLRVSGYDTKPFSAPRWETTGGQVYSDTAPAFDALPDLRELELMARRYGRGMDNLVKPALVIAASLQQTALSLDPGSMNFVNDLQGGARPILTPDPNVLPAIEKGRDYLTRRVNQLFYADLWMAITDMEGVQPRNEQELLYRNEEKLTQLGPVVDRVNIEKLEVDIDRIYTIRKNLGRVRPAPPEMEGHALNINFVSILAQAQKAAANTQIERAARFVGFVAGLYPDAALKFDAEQAIDEFAQNAGTTPKIIRSDEVVAQMKAKIDQQKQMQAMVAAAPAARDAAQAAQLASQTRTGPDTSMLDQLMGQ